MSNRFLGILILIGFMGIIISFYLYFFKYNKVNIEIVSNLTSYEVKLSNNDLKNTINKKCDNKKCFFKELPPFNYKVTISKKGYKDVYNKLYIRENGITKLYVTLEKDIYLKKISKKELYNNIESNENKESKEEKIKNLRIKKKIKKEIILENLGKFIFIDSGNKIELINNNESLGLFENSEEIDIKKIFYTDNFFFLSIGDKKYIYNIVSKNFFVINLATKINYIKSGKDNLNFNIITKNGTFIYNIKNREVKYFTLFKDFEIIGDDYISIIYSDENQKFKNFGYKNEKNENFIIRYNKNTFKKGILYKTNKNISKIIQIEDDKGNPRIIIYNKENEIYELMNF